MQPILVCLPGLCLNPNVKCLMARCISCFQGDSVVDPNNLFAYGGCLIARFFCFSAGIDFQFPFMDKTVNS